MRWGQGSCAGPAKSPPGEWGCGIIFWSKVTKIEENEHGEEEEKDIFFLKQYTVFCIDQVEADHLDHLRAKSDGPLNTTFVDFKPAERVIAGTEADIRYTGDRAFYRKDRDFIQVPPKTKFPKENEFYSTCFHELAHWSECRTDWKGDYPESEIRAEVAAAYMLAELGVPQSSDLSNHQAYVANWLQALRNDNKFIFRASTAANRAADYIMSFSHQPEPELVDVPF